MYTRTWNGRLGLVQKQNHSNFIPHRAHPLAFASTAINTHVYDTYIAYINNRSIN